MTYSPLFGLHHTECHQSGPVDPPSDTAHTVKDRQKQFSVIDQVKVKYPRSFYFPQKHWGFFLFKPSESEISYSKPDVICHDFSQHRYDKNDNLISLLSYFCFG